MTSLEELNKLIDMASAIAGSDAKLAKAIGAVPQHVSNWRNGHRPCPAADMALMAGMAGLDANAWLVRATLDKHEGTAKGDQLFKALGKALRATGGALALNGLAGLAIYSQIIDRCSTMYIM